MSGNFLFCDIGERYIVLLYQRNTLSTRCMFCMSDVNAIS